MFVRLERVFVILTLGVVVFVILFRREGGEIHYHLVIFQPHGDLFADTRGRTTASVATAVTSVAAHIGV